MTFYKSLPWHEGEAYMHKTLAVPDHDNPTVPALSAQAINMLQRAPLLAIGTLDTEGRPWTTLLGGDTAFARPLGQGILGVRTAVTGQYDPVIETLVGEDATGEVQRETANGKMVGGLAIDLEARKRVKIYGRMIAGALGIKHQDGDATTGTQSPITEMQLVLKVEQSLGNCPKYLNKKHIVPAPNSPSLQSDSLKLPRQALELIEKADLFFVSSSHLLNDMDTNHRGGPAGFVRVLENEDTGAVIVWPEYSGNRLYQTLGNLYTTPLAGICIPDFDTGDMLYMTGKTETLIGVDAAMILPRSNLAVKLMVTAARFVKSALPFRGVSGEYSPYNPPLRYLYKEQNLFAASQPTPQAYATLVSQTQLTPTISRFKFASSHAVAHTPGQYVTLDFAPHLDVGYSHMRDDDPRSLNDDFVRTFTVSNTSGHLEENEFEITIRNVGVVTNFLFRQRDARRASERLEVGLKGFGGDFEIKQDDDRSVCFIAAGVGITPLLSSLDSLDSAKAHIIWTVRAEDVGLVLDVLRQSTHIKRNLELFITGNTEGHHSMQELRDQQVTMYTRRFDKMDLQKISANEVYICTSASLREQIITYLGGKKTFHEDFNF